MRDQFIQFMKICAIVLNYNLPADTISVVADLKKQVLPKNWKLEIIVVDNASTDNSIEKIRLAYPEIILLPQPQNLGVAGGYNAGLRYALKSNPDYLVVLNNDLIIDQKNCLEILVKTLKNNKKSGAVVPMIYFAKGFEYHGLRYHQAELGKVIWYAGGIIDWNNILLSHRGVDKTNSRAYQKIEDTDFITGAFMVFKKEILKKVGLFDEKYYLYLEDADLSQRIKRAGYRLLFVPQAKISHKVSQTSGNKIGGELNDYYIARNRLLFGLKYAGLRTKIALLREALRLLSSGRSYQKEAVKDFFLLKFGRKNTL